MRIFLSSLSAMSLESLFSDFVAHLHSAEFLESARHKDHPSAFSRRRKLPLPSLVAVLLSGMRKSVQTELDEFFAHLQQQAQLARQVSAQAFAQARVKLASTAIPSLNDWLIARAEPEGYLNRWYGLRLVAADASTIRLGLRASHQPRAANADQILLGPLPPRNRPHVVCQPSQPSRRGTSNALRTTPSPLKSRSFAVGSGLSVSVVGRVTDPAADPLLYESRKTGRRV